MRPSTFREVAQAIGALLGVLLVPSATVAQTDVEELGRRHGAMPPAGYYETLRLVPDAFQFSSRNGWVRRGLRVATARNRARSLLISARREDPHAPRVLLSVEAQTADGVVAGDLNVPVFLIMFSDTDSSALHLAVPYEAISARLYGTDPAPPYSVHTYYREVSNDNLFVNGTVYPWTRVPETSLHYAGNSNGLDATGDMPGLITHIVSAHDDTVDFGLFDNDGPDGIPNSGDDDGYVDAIVMIHPQVDGSCKNRNPDATNSIWAHRFSRSAWSGSGGPYVTDDVSHSTGESYILVDDYIVQGGQGGDDGCTSNEPQAMGVVAHETGHLLGLPDLYDMNTSGNGIGRWGLMGSGNHLVPSRPAHLTAWSKARLGWVTEVLVARDTTLRLNPIITSDTSLIVPVASTPEYFILENRQPLGSDTEMYREGLLVYHADSMLIRSRGNEVNGFKPYGLAVVQADGRDDLAEGANRGDDGDPFPGSTNNVTLGVCTNPSSKTNFWGPSHVILDSIMPLEPGGAMRVNVRFFQPEVLGTENRAFTGQTMGTSFFHQFVAVGGVECDRRWSLADGKLPKGLLLDADGRLWGRLEETGEFTARIQVVSGAQLDTATVTVSVAVPALAVDAVVRHLLGAPDQLTFYETVYLDLQGNRNGRFDLGDFLGWVRSTGGQVSAAEMAELVESVAARETAAGRRP